MNGHNEINDVSPSSLSHIIGQRSVVEQIRVATEAAFADGRKFDHALLVGPPGLGKTQIASVIACEMATELHEVLGQSVKAAADLNGILLAALDKQIVHFDEIHEMKREFQTGLYRAVEERKLFIQGRSSVQSIPLADFTVLLSTTDEFSVLQPLRDRMRLVLRFQFYTDEELAVLLRQRSRALNWVVDEAVFPLLAQRARGTPRLALRLLQAARRVCRAEGDRTITLAHLERACGLKPMTCRAPWSSPGGATFSTTFSRTRGRNESHDESEFPARPGGRNARRSGGAGRVRPDPRLLPGPARLGELGRRGRGGLAAERGGAQGR
jgi:Holliday junction DNA helicase RuvB